MSQPGLALLDITALTGTVAYVTVRVLTHYKH